MGDVNVDPEQLLEQRGLSTLLQDFVVDAADAMPEDLVLFMAEWAAKKKGLTLTKPLEHAESSDRVSVSSGSGRPLHSWAPTERSGSTGVQPFHSLSSLAPGLAARGKAKGITAVMMGTRDSNVTNFLDILEGERAQQPSPRCASYLSFVRSRIDFHSLRNVAYLPIEHEVIADPVIFLDKPSTELDATLAALVSISDVVFLVVSCRTAAKDLAKKRQGELYNRVLLVHGLAVQKMVLVLTDTRELSQSGMTAVETGLNTMMTKCGFGGSSQYRILRNPDSAERVVSQLAAFPASRRTVSDPETANGFRAQLMALGPHGLSRGEQLMMFSTELLTASIEIITDNGVTVDHLPQHRYGKLSFSVVAVPPVARLALKAPIVAFRDGVVVAVGAVVDVDSLDDEEDGGDAAAEFHVNDAQ